MKFKLLLIGFLFMAKSASAALLVDHLSLQAEVTNTCNVIAGNLSFGTINIAYGNPGYATTSAILRVTCTKNTAYTIKLSPGNSGNFTGSRYMINSVTGGKLNYNLYSPRNPAVVWGDGSGNTYYVSSIGTGVEQYETIQAQLPYSQLAMSGNYSDSILVTINY